MKKIFLSIISICSLVSIVGCNNSTTPVDEEKIYQEGYDAGYAAGYDAGYNSGSNDGYDLGFENGTEIGYDSGYVQGYQDGLADSGKDAFVRPGTNLESHTSLQQSYIDDNPKLISKYANGGQGKELCAPEAITLNWSDVKFYEKCSSYTVVLSDNYDFTNTVEYKTTNTILNVYNLKLNASYFWYLKATGQTTTFASPIFTFTTKNGLIRNLYVPGSTNWRDLGNYTLSNGKKIKQGLVYRSAAFSFYDGTTGPILEETKNCILNELKIKTDIALADTASIQGLNRVSATMKWENISNIIADSDNKNSIKTVFNCLGNANNYPVVFHCTRGRDRTGAIAFLLGAYLGMDINDLYRDYLFTNFSASNNCGIGPIEAYEDYLLDFSGNNLQERTESYLKSIGVSETTLSNIKNTLVG